MRDRNRKEVGQRKRKIEENTQYAPQPKLVYTRKKT